MSILTSRQTNHVTRNTEIGCRHRFWGTSPQCNISGISMHLAIQLHQQWVALLANTGLDSRKFCPCTHEPKALDSSPALKCTASNIHQGPNTEDPQINRTQVWHLQKWFAKHFNTCSSTRTNGEVSWNRIKKKKKVSVTSKCFTVQTGVLVTNHG